jgi:hypothetical protein
MTTQQNYNYNLLEEILLNIKKYPGEFNMDTYRDSMGRKCIAGWALELNNIPVDFSTASRIAQELLNISRRESQLLFFFLGNYENNITSEERNQHTINVLELILEKRNFTIEQAVDGYVEGNKLHLLQDELI